MHIYSAFKNICYYQPQHVYIYIYIYIYIYPKTKQNTLAYVYSLQCSLANRIKATITVHTRSTISNVSHSTTSHELYMHIYSVINQISDQWHTLLPSSQHILKNRSGYCIHLLVHKWYTSELVTLSCKYHI
jgi:hypothetical protein